MTKGDLLVERGADRLQELADRAAARGDGVGEWLSEELRTDAAFLRKLKPSLVKARAKGSAPTDQEPEAPPPASPTEPALGSRPKPKGKKKKRKGGGAPRPCWSWAQPSSPGSCSQRSSTGEAMHTHETEHDAPGLGATVKSVSEHASSLVRLELELAALELKRKVASLGIGIGLALGAAVLLVFALGFGLATIAAGIATALDWWISLLIVTVGLLLVAGLLGMLGMRKIQKGTPPVPEQALAEAKKTSEALKANGHR